MNMYLLTRVIINVWILYINYEFKFKIILINSVNKLAFSDFETVQVLVFIILSLKKCVPSVLYSFARFKWKKLCKVLTEKNTMGYCVYSDIPIRFDCFTYYWKKKNIYLRYPSEVYRFEYQINRKNTAEITHKIIALPLSRILLSLPSPEAISPT